MRVAIIFINTRTLGGVICMCNNALHWCYNDHDGVSNHQSHGCLLNRLFRRRSKKTSKLRVTGLCVGNSPGPVNSPHKGPVTRKMVSFDDVIMDNDSHFLITHRFGAKVIIVDMKSNNCGNSSIALWVSWRTIYVNLNDNTFLIDRIEI